MKVDKLSKGFSVESVTGESNYSILSLPSSEKKCILKQFDRKINNSMNYILIQNNNNNTCNNHENKRNFRFCLTSNLACPWVPTGSHGKNNQPSTCRKWSCDNPVAR
jgi:hypothetical protein